MGRSGGEALQKIFCCDFRICFDNFELKNYKLMPMGNDALFLPVKAAIRKKIGKEAGDMVRVKIYIDEGHFETPEEIQLCLDNESKIVQKNFSRLTEGEQKTWIDWIYEAKKDETKVDRIVCFMKSLEEGKRFIEKKIKSFW